MTVPEFTRFVISGTMPGGEQWATSFAALSPGNTQADLNTDTDNIKTFLEGSSTAVAALRGLWSSQTACTAVRGYNYPAGSTSASLQSEALVTSCDGLGSGHAPNQIAIVASLRTALPGRSHRGRMYWPANGVSYSTDGQLPTGQGATIAGAVKTLFAVLSAAGPVQVISRMLGVATPVNAIRVDSRLDIIRGRAKSESIDTTGVVAYP